MGESQDLEINDSRTNKILYGSAIIMVSLAILLLFYSKAVICKQSFEVTKEAMLNEQGDTTPRYARWVLFTVIGSIVSCIASVILRVKSDLESMEYISTIYGTLLMIYIVGILFYVLVMC